MTSLKRWLAAALLFGSVVAPVLERVVLARGELTVEEVQTAFGGVDGGLMSGGNKEQYTTARFWECKKASPLLPMLADLPRLDELHIALSPVVEADFVSLSKQRGLVHFSCLDLNVSLKSFDTFLADKPHLNILDITNSAIDNDTLKAIGKLPALRVLRISNFPKAWIEKPPEFFPYLEAVRNRNAIGDEGMAHLAPLRDLTILSIAETDVTDRGLVVLKDLRKLKTLSLNGLKVTDKGLEALADLDQLEVLYLGQMSLTDEGCATLAKLKSLRELFVSGTKVTDDGCAVLAKMTALTELYLNETMVTDAGLRHLLPLTNLKELGLSGTKVTDEAISLIAKFPKLEKVSLFETAISEKAIATLKKLRPGLNVFYPDGTCR